MLLRIIAELAMQDLETGLSLQEAITKSMEEVMIRREMTLEEFTEQIKEECQSGN